MRSQVTRMNTLVRLTPKKKVKNRMRVVSMIQLVPSRMDQSAKAF